MVGLSALLIVVHSPLVSYAQTVTTSITPSALPPCGAPCGSGVTTVTQNAATYNITGGARPGNGANLFHSFGTFSVATPDTANFVNDQALPTTNIISRVTGGQVSNIFGTLQTTNFGTAALWLINPSGIVFGPNAALNVGGAVHFSTADYVRMFDGVASSSFFADLNRNSALTSAPVTAFGFLGPTPPRAIDVRGGTVSVPNGQTLSLLGGQSGFTDPESGTTPGGVNVTNGSLAVASGRINLVSLGGTSGGGEVGISGTSPFATSAATGFQSLGTVSLSNGAVVSTSGNVSSSAGGTVYIQGGRLVLFDNSSVTSNGVGTGAAGSVIVRVPSVEVTGTSPAVPAVLSATAVSGPGGGLDLSEASTFTSVNGTMQADSITIGAGPSGGTAIGMTNTTVQGRALSLAADSVTLTSSTISASATGSAAAGTIRVGAPSVTIANSTVAATAVDGAGGTIDFTDAVSYTSTNSSVQAQATGIGQGGTVTIGSAGNSSIALTNTTLQGGSVALTGSAVTMQGSTVTAFASSGNGGIVTVRADQATLGSNAGLGTVTSGTATGGNVLIEGLGSGTAAASVILTDSAITTTTGSTGSAKAGDVTVNADSVQMTRATISTNAAGTGAGGRIVITGNNEIALLDHTLQTTVSGGTGAPTGDISLTTPDLTLSGGTITTQTLGTRRAGGIALNVDALTMQPGTPSPQDPTASPVIESEVASGSTGGAGNISIQGLGGAGTIPRVLRLIQASILQNDNVASQEIVAEDLGIELGASELIELGPGTVLKADVQHLVQAADCVPGNCDPRNRGFIELSVPQLMMRGSTIDARANGTGRSGDITLNVQTFVADEGAVVTTKSGTALEECGPSCTSLRGGAGGNITIQGIGGPGTPAETVTIQNNSMIAADTTNSGAGGNIQIRTISLDVRNGGTISSSSTGNTPVVAEPGPGGNLILAVDGQFRSNRGTLSTQAVQGGGGNINILAGDIQLVNGSTITAESDGAGNAGSITLVSGQNIMIENSSVRTSAANASGGDIKLTAPGTILLDNSQVTSSVNGPVGSNGGNIGIDPEFVLLRNSSQILAQAFAGRGGNINIVANTFLAEPGTVIDASSQLGVSGTISIQSPIQNLAGAIAPLPQAFVNIANLYGQHCAAEKSGQFSSFVQGTRDALPPQPGDFLSSPLSSDALGFSSSGSLGQPNLIALRLALYNLTEPPATTFPLVSGCRS